MHKWSNVFWERVSQKRQKPNEVIQKTVSGYFFERNIYILVYLTVDRTLLYFSIKRLKKYGRDYLLLHWLTPQLRISQFKVFSSPLLWDQARADPSDWDWEAPARSLSPGRWSPAASRSARRSPAAPLSTWRQTWASQEEPAAVRRLEEAGSLKPTPGTRLIWKKQKNEYSYLSALGDIRYN